MIHNAKVKRAYSRTLKREEKSGFLPRSLDSFKTPNTEEVGANSIVYSDGKKLEDADLETLHPSRSQALTAAPTADAKPPRSDAKTSRPRPPILTKEEKAAIAARHKQEKEQAQREREKKIKRRERLKKNFQKMTKRGQPVMKPRLEHLLSKVKKIMKEE